MKWIISIVAWMLSFLACAQSPYGPTNDSLYLGFYRDSIAMLERPMIMVVPFHPKRYLSEIDRYIAEGTNYTFQHTRGFFRKGLDNAILIGAKEHNEYVSMHADDPVINEDLEFIYKMVATSVMPYEPPIVQEPKGFKRHLYKYWVKLQTNVEKAPEPGTRLENGQIVSVSDYRELITKARVINPLVFDSLAPKYGVKYFLFVNELNLMNAATNQTQLELENYDRVIKVHYSVYDDKGNELFSLIKKRYFSSQKNDLPTIIVEDILPAGQEVIFSLDSYRFLQAGMTPLTETEVEMAKGKKGIKLPPLSKFK